MRQEVTKHASPVITGGVQIQHHVPKRSFPHCLINVNVVVVVEVVVVLNVVTVVVEVLTSV